MLTLPALWFVRACVQYDAPVSSYWPAFAAHGKDKLTVAQLLAHQAGLHNAVTPVTELAKIADWDGMCAAMADAKPAYPVPNYGAPPAAATGLAAGAAAASSSSSSSSSAASSSSSAAAAPGGARFARCDYHYLSYGWLVGGLVGAATKGRVTLRELWDKEVTVPLGIQRECLIGLPQDTSHEVGTSQGNAHSARR